MTDSLYKDIVGNCPLCKGTAYQGDEPCECRHKLAAYSRMMEGGFYKPTLDFVTDPFFAHPTYVSGDSFVQYYLNNPGDIVEKGLSLYLYSRERGRGKTTLAHLVVYCIADFFGPRRGNYTRNQTYGFETSGDLIANFINKEEGHTKKTIYVLDDLGNEDRVAWKKEILVAALQKVFQNRRSLNLPTIITSNYFPGDLSRKYDGVLDSLLEIRPDGTIGGNLFRQVEVGGGEDLRIAGASSWPI